MIPKFAICALLLVAMLGSRSTTQASVSTEESCEPSSSISCAPSTDQDGQQNENGDRITLSELFQIICRETKLATCAMQYLDIDDEHRIIRAKTSIEELTGLIEASDALQMTRIDALRDPRVQHIFQQHLKIVGDGKKEEYLSSIHYMALFLSFEFHRLDDESVHWDYASPKDQARRAYFNYLPTFEDYAYHPIHRAIFSEPEPTDQEGSTFNLNPYIDQVTEKEASDIMDAHRLFSSVSLEFEQQISLESFVRANIAVMSRTFAKQITEDDISKEEIDKYAPFLSDGKRDIGFVMVPLLDSFNHHSENHHADWMDKLNDVSDCSDDTRSLTFLTKRSVDAGEPILTSYGKHSEQTFYAIYGFVVPDRSDYPTVNLASAHNLLRPVSSVNLQFYLNYWDGYNECPPTIDSTAENVAESPQIDVYTAKVNALKVLSERQPSWLIEARGDRKPQISEQILTICRIIALTHRDYDGWATALLEKIATTPDFNYLRPSKNIELEYRAYHALKRLAETSIQMLRDHLKQFATYSWGKPTSSVELEVQQKLNNGGLDPMSYDGQRSYIFLREIEVLKEVVEIAQTKMDSILADGKTVLEQKKFVRDATNPYGDSSISEDFIVREQFCIPKAKYKTVAKSTIGSEKVRVE